jgi:NAD(P)-dependent dehydrogenase (short-subunit alcohol dehydrogenase family)
MNRLPIAGRVAVITGAGSGIGRAVAQSLAARGCHLAIADVDEAGLAETESLLAEAGVRVTRHRLDVTDAAAVAALPATVAGAHGGVDILVNNAGVALGGTFEQVSDTDFEWVVNVNFWGVVRMTRTFLPLLHASDDARLVNLSSLFGLVAPPGQAAYCASKFAVRGFSESLRKELVGTRIGVTVVHPGGVATRIAKNARRPAGVNAIDAAKEEKRFERLLRMPPERAGEIIVSGVERRRERILVGSDAKAAALIERLMPLSYWKLLGRGAR